MAGVLTAGEKVVLSLGAQGLVSKEIAAQLLVSKRTVDFHFDNIYRKMCVSNRIQAIIEARKQGEIK
jgi:DNA-binding NarL/FixJ family response regulator